MPVTYKFQEVQQPEILDREKVIVKSTPVEATVEEETFSLKNKEDELVNAEKVVVGAQKRVDDLTAEIEEIKLALEIA